MTKILIPAGVDRAKLKQHAFEHVRADTQWLLATCALPSEAVLDGQPLGDPDSDLCMLGAHDERQVRAVTSERVR